MPGGQADNGSDEFHDFSYGSGIGLDVALSGGQIDMASQKLVVSQVAAYSPAQLKERLSLVPAHGWVGITSGILDANED